MPSDCMKWEKPGMLVPKLARTERFDYSIRV